MTNSEIVYRAYFCANVTIPQVAIITGLSEKETIHIIEKIRTMINVNKGLIREFD